MCDVNKSRGRERGNAMGAQLPVNRTRIQSLKLREVASTASSKLVAELASVSPARRHRSGEADRLRELGWSNFGHFEESLTCVG